MKKKRGKAELKPQAELKREYYPFMDGLRAVGILWVMLLHLTYFFDLRPLWGQWFPYYFRVAQIGFLGVDIFFVISGFLITGLLIKDFQGQIGIKRFYLRRFFKIMPQYLMIVVIGVVIVSLLGKARFWDRFHWSVISFFFLFQNYVRPFGLLSHLWSIAVEEHFYFLYPLLLSLIFLIKSPHHRRNVTIFILLCLIVFGNYLRMIHLQFAENLRYPFEWQKTHVRFDGLLFGCLIKIMEPFLLGKTFKRILTPFFYFILGTAIFISFIVYFNEDMWQEYTLAYLASGLILIAGLKGFAPLKLFLETRIMRFIGKNSYAIYLWHYVIILMISSFFRKKSVGWAFLAFAVSLLAGIISTKTIERYFLNLRKKIVA